MIKLTRFFVTGFHFHGRLHQFTSPLLYSTTSDNDIAMVDFLVKIVGFSDYAALSVAANCKFSQRFKSYKKSQLAIDFLKSSGLDDTLIRKLVVVDPIILRSKVEETLKPRFGVLQDLGLNGSDLGFIMSKNSKLLHKSLKGDGVPAFEMLKQLFDSNEQLLSFLLRADSQKLLSTSALQDLPRNLLLLRSYGVPRGRVKWLMLLHPGFISASTEWVEKILKRVEEKLGIPRTSSAFVRGVSALSCVSDDFFEKWRQAFYSYGWSETQVSGLLRKQPSCLGLSEKEVRAKLKIFMEEFGCDCDYLAQRPNLLSYSMEKRIVPRATVIRALKEKQKLRSDFSVYTLASITEAEFMQKYMLPVKDKLPELYEYYILTKGGSLTKKLSMI